jgi:hypothetical protein
LGKAGISSTIASFNQRGRLVKIAGFDKLSRSLDELSKFAKEIDGHLGQVAFNPHDPGDIERALNEMESMVDQHASAYGRNDAVQNIATQMKEAYRRSILDKAAGARLGAGN